VYGLLFAFAMFISPDPTFFSQLIVLAILAALFEVGLFLSIHLIGDCTPRCSHKDTKVLFTSVIPVLFRSFWPVFGLFSLRFAVRKGF
jgi:hypothetical protein